MMSPAWNIFIPSTLDIPISTGISTMPPILMLYILLMGSTFGYLLPESRARMQFIGILPAAILALLTGISTMPPILMLYILLMGSTFGYLLPESRARMQFIGILPAAILALLTG